MLMLLSMHVTRVLFVVLAGNFALTVCGLLLELYTLTQASRLFLCTLGTIDIVLCLEPTSLVPNGPTKGSGDINLSNSLGSISVDYFLQSFPTANHIAGKTICGCNTGNP